MSGKDGLGAGLGEVTLGGDALVAAGTEECEGVVHADADCGVCALDDGHLQGPQEGLCVHQVGCDLFSSRPRSVSASVTSLKSRL